MAKGLGIGRTLTVGIVAVVVGIAIGIGGLFAIQNAGGNSKISPSVVFDRMVAQNEMVTVSQSYSITDKYSDAYSFFDLFDIPFTDNALWYRYVGTLKAGVNMQTAEFQADGATITIALDEPYIISNTPDMNETGVLEERDGFFNPVHASKVDEVQRNAVAISEEKAIEGGLLEEAKANAEDNITEMFDVALGDGYTVKFNWREVEPASQPAEESASDE